MNNVVVFVLSPFGGDDKSPHDFTDVTRSFQAQTKQTNESCLKYLMWKLGKAGQTLDKAFAFVTPNLLENGDYEKFKALFPNLPIEYILLPEGLVSDAMKTIPKMHDTLLAYQRQHFGDNIRISVDITGGFRHASMMMLPLIQLLRYSGFEIGDILYANMSVNPKVVEDASDLLDFTSLIGGAEEFISFGSVKQIQNYFAGVKPSLRLQHLLAKMEALSETLRICGSYDLTEDALIGLGNAIKIYEDSLRGDKNIDAQELYFSKLIPRIKSEYREILPTEGEPVSPEGIIRWCLHKGLLQQAITFYTEWLPRFLVESRRIYVKDQTIIDDCKAKGNLWSHWSIYLLRSYRPDADGQTELDADGVLTYGSMVPVLQAGDLSRVMDLARGKNPKLEDFLEHIRDFCQEKGNRAKASDILGLPEDDLIRKVMEWTAPTNTSVERYVEGRIIKEPNAESVIVKALSTLPKDKQCRFFASDEGNDPKEDAKQNKPQWRRELFQYLMEHNFITTTLQPEKLLDFVERYEMIVEELRNKFAHANSDSGTVQGQEDIIDAIEESLDFITVK